MLVSDVRGYTRISEKIAPGKLAQIVGGWYKQCYQTLHEQGATVDKFIGDSVLASWTGNSEKEAVRAIAAAVGLQKACAEIHQAHAEVLTPHDWVFSAGVGIHMGQVSYGSAGLGGRTILGDAVNVTFHLEALTRQIPHAILLSADVLGRSPSLLPSVEFCGEFPMKSRSEMLGVYALKNAPS
jgi:adenylate cyclase